MAKDDARTARIISVVCGMALESAAKMDRSLRVEGGEVLAKIREDNI